MDTIFKIEKNNEKKSQPVVQIEKVEVVKPLMICHHW